MRPSGSRLLLICLFVATLSGCGGRSAGDERADGVKVMPTNAPPTEPETAADPREQELRQSLEEAFSGPAEWQNDNLLACMDIQFPRRLAGLEITTSGVKTDVAIELRGDLPSLWTSDTLREPIEALMVAFYRLVFTSGLDIRDASAVVYLRGSECSDERAYQTSLPGWIAEHIDWNGGDASISDAWVVVFMSPTLKSGATDAFDG